MGSPPVIHGRITTGSFMVRPGHLESIPAAPVLRYRVRISTTLLGTQHAHAPGGWFVLRKSRPIPNCILEDPFQTSGQLIMLMDKIRQNSLGLFQMFCTGSSGGICLTYQADCTHQHFRLFGYALEKVPWTHFRVIQQLPETFGWGSKSNFCSITWICKCGHKHQIPCRRGSI